MPLWGMLCQSVGIGSGDYSCFRCYHFPWLVIAVETDYFQGVVKKVCPLMFRFCSQTKSGVVPGSASRVGVVGLFFFISWRGEGFLISFYLSRLCGISFSSLPYLCGFSLVLQVLCQFVSQRVSNCHHYLTLFVVAFPCMVLQYIAEEGCACPPFVVGCCFHQLLFPGVNQLIKEVWILLKFTKKTTIHDVVFALFPFLVGCDFGPDTDDIVGISCEEDGGCS